MKKKEKDFLDSTKIHLKLLLLKIRKIISIWNFRNILYGINGIKSRKFDNIKNV